MKIPVSREPSECCIVFSDHGRVGCCSEAEINIAVFDYRTIRMVVAHRWQMIDQRSDVASWRNAEYTSTFHFSSFSNVEVAIVKSQASPWTVPGAFCNHCSASVLF